MARGIPPSQNPVKVIDPVPWFKTSTTKDKISLSIGRFSPEIQRDLQITGVKTTRRSLSAESRDTEQD